MIDVLQYDEFEKRRRAFLDRLSDNSVAIVRSSDSHERTFGTTYRYRQRSNFYYLTGFEEKNAIALFIKAQGKQEYIIFSRPLNPGMELLQGNYLGQEKAIFELGADRAYEIDKFDVILFELLKGKSVVYYQISVDEVIGKAIRNVISQLLDLVRRGVAAPTVLKSLDVELQELRHIKSAQEIELIKHCCEITQKAHLSALRSLKTSQDKPEYIIEEKIVSEYIKHGAVQAYSPVVSCGTPDCVMHHRDVNKNRLESGELVLIDSGAEFGYYSTDLARTYPLSGKFTKEQKQIYNLVLKGQLEMLALIKPGIGFDVLLNKLEGVFTEGLIELGILKGDYEDLISRKAYKHYFPHNIGHWVGMDIHDEVTYCLPSGEWRPFAIGTVLTVEPGLYFREGDCSIDCKWWNIGVHIEDMVLVTEEGHEILSSKLPKNVSDIEEIMNKEVEG